MRAAERADHDGSPRRTPLTGPAGEGGIEKTALLEYASAAAYDLTALRAVGVESEMELAYAARHRLCGPLLDRLESLRAPQHEALIVVFGCTESGYRPIRLDSGV